MFFYLAYFATRPCGGRTRTYDLRVMSTGIEVPKDEENQQRTGVFSRFCRPFADGDLKASLRKVSVLLPCRSLPPHFPGKSHHTGKHSGKNLRSNRPDKRHTGHQHCSNLPNSRSFWLTPNKTITATKTAQKTPI